MSGRVYDSDEETEGRPAFVIGVGGGMCERAYFQIFGVICWQMLHCTLDIAFDQVFEFCYLSCQIDFIVEQLVMIRFYFIVVRKSSPHPQPK